MIHVFKISRLKSIREYYSVLQSVTEYSRVLESVTECYRVLQSITENSRVLQNIKEYYRVFLAHLLGPISGLVYTPPDPVIKVILHCSSPSNVTKLTQKYSNKTVTVLSLSFKVNSVE